MGGLPLAEVLEKYRQAAMSAPLAKTLSVLSATSATGSHPDSGFWVGVQGHK